MDPPRDHGQSQPPPPASQDALARLKTFAARFEPTFRECLEPIGHVPPVLREAVHYTAFAPGKRLRPYLVARACELAGGTEKEARPVAAAIECIHAFSLIHDDLPAMDDDDLRRGRPTCHKQHGEGMAILAGDALAGLAFELIGRHIDDGALAGKLTLELAQAMGWSGMIGGQAADIDGETQPPDLDLARFIHARKTARLFEAACRMGALVGRASAEHVGSLARFGQMLGITFQIADDLLDVTSTPEAMGKTVRKDAHVGKQTYPRCVGVEGSRVAAREAVEKAIAELSPFGTEADDLRALAGYAADRNF